MHQFLTWGSPRSPAKPATKPDAHSRKHQKHTKKHFVTADLHSTWSGPCQAVTSCASFLQILASPKPIELSHAGKWAHRRGP